MNDRAVRRRVLMVSPHFPPDTSAGAHRVRLLGPRLPEFGWDPVVVAVAANRYEGAIDPGLLALVPSGLRVVRSSAWPAGGTRRLGIGDLGIRAYTGLRRACVGLLEREHFDAVFITMYPTYPALLGPMLKRRFHTPFVLDYQDPWVGAWGDTVGGGVDGGPDWKSRATRRLAEWLEPRVVRAADALTAVSAATYEAVVERNPDTSPALRATLPIGGEAADLDAIRDGAPNGFFDPRDGFCHISYVGTLLPLGVETMRAILQAVAMLKARQPALYGRLRLHYVGTSNQTGGRAPERVLPIASALGVADCVSERPLRVPYLDALRIQADSHVLLLAGSSERHYTASKIYPALLARRPLLAVYHESSEVVTALKRVGRPPTIRVVTYDDQGAGAATELVYTALAELIAKPRYEPADVDLAAMEAYSARAIAGRLADVLDRVAGAAA